MHNIDMVHAKAIIYIKEQNDREGQVIIMEDEHKRKD